MPASGSSSELSSHQMAIRSHPGVQKNARQWHFIRAERSSNGSCREPSRTRGLISALVLCVRPLVQSRIRPLIVVGTLVFSLLSWPPRSQAFEEFSYLCSLG